MADSKWYQWRRWIQTHQESHSPLTVDWWPPWSCLVSVWTLSYPHRAQWHSTSPWSSPWSAGLQCCLLPERSTSHWSNWGTTHIHFTFSLRTCLPCKKKITHTIMGKQTEYSVPVERKRIWKECVDDCLQVLCGEDQDRLCDCNLHLLFRDDL